jgi:hypothetical protein
LNSIRMLRRSKQRVHLLNIRLAFGN